MRVREEIGVGRSGGVGGEGGGGGGGGWCYHLSDSRMQFHPKRLTCTVNKFLFKDSCFLQLNIVDFHN